MLQFKVIAHTIPEVEPDSLFAGDGLEVTVSATSVNGQGIRFNTKDYQKFPVNAVLNIKIDRVETGKTNAVGSA